MKTVTIKQREYVPINRTAANVTRSGFEYIPTYKINPTEKIFLSPPFTYPPPRNKQNLTGTRRGRIKILGYIENDTWSARCDCGRYTLRNGRNWRKGLRLNKDDQGCPHCMQLHQLRRKAQRLSEHNKHECQDNQDNINQSEITP